MAACAPGDPTANMCSMVVCVLLPRFELVVAAGGRARLAEGPAALAPEPGREEPIWESSAISQDAPDLVRFRRPRPEVTEREPTPSGRS